MGLFGECNRRQYKEFKRKSYRDMDIGYKVYCSNYIGIKVNTKIAAEVSESITFSLSQEVCDYIRTEYIPILNKFIW